MSKLLKSVPKFANETDERLFWDTRNFPEYLE